MTLIHEYRWPAALFLVCVHSVQSDRAHNLLARFADQRFFLDCLSLIDSSCFSLPVEGVKIFLCYSGCEVLVIIEEDSWEIILEVLLQFLFGVDYNFGEDLALLVFRKILIKANRSKQAFIRLCQDIDCFWLKFSF